MQKLALISDIHSNIVALDSVLSHIKEQDCRDIICCGDLVGYGPRPNEVIERIRDLKIPTVMGNYDEAVGFLLPVCGCNIDDTKQKKLSNNSLKWTTANTTDHNRKFLRELPENMEISFGEKHIIVIHSSFESMSEYIYETDSERISELLDSIEQDIYVYGHTHFPFLKRVKDKIIVNTGSVGRPKNCDNRATYVLLEFDGEKIDGQIQKVSYDFEKVANEIEESELDSYFAEFIRNGGDIESTCNVKENCSCNIDINSGERNRLY